MEEPNTEVLVREQRRRNLPRHLRPDGETPLVIPRRSTRRQRLPEPQIVPPEERVPERVPEVQNIPAELRRRPGRPRRQGIFLD